MRDTLGIIHPVNPQPDQLALQPPLPLQPLHLRRHFPALRKTAQVVKVNADGKRPYQGSLPLIFNAVIFGVHFQRQRPRRRLHKIAAMIADVKPQQVIPQQSRHQLPLPRTNAENLRMRPGNMPELPGDDVRRRVADVLRQQCQMIILGQHNGRPPPDFIQYQVGELAIDRLISLPIPPVKNRLRIGVMAQRPQGFIGKAVIIPLLLLLRQPDQPQRIGRILRRHHHPVIPIHYIAVAAAAPIGNPGPAARLHQRIQRAGQPPGRHHRLRLPLHQGMDIRLAVGNDNQPVIANLPLHQPLQILFSPHTNQPLRPARLKATRPFRRP